MTNIHDPSHDEFEATQFNISLTGKDCDPFPRRLHRVSQAARDWDKTSAQFALYSERHNCYSYVWLRITGHRVRYSPNYRLTVRVDFEDQDAKNCEAIMLLPDGGMFVIEQVKELGL